MVWNLPGATHQSHFQQNLGSEGLFLIIFHLWFRDLLREKEKQKEEIRKYIYKSKIITRIQLLYELLLEDIFIFGISFLLRESAKLLQEYNYYMNYPWNHECFVEDLFLWFIRLRNSYFYFTVPRVRESIQ